MPTEALRKHCSPFTWNSRESASTTLSAMSHASCAWCRFVSITVNSSPPRRATVSVVRTQREMRRTLKEIRNGKFARQWIEENRRGSKNFRRLLKRDISHPIERVGEKLRARMPWLKEAR